MARRIVLRVKSNFDPPNLQKWQQVWTEEVTDAFQMLGGETAEVARLLAPVGITTIYKESIDHVVEKRSPTRIALVIFSSDNQIKAQVIEGVDEQGNETQYGRQPGTFAPVDVIRAWVIFKFALVTPQEIDRATWLVNLKIFREGILPVRPIKLAVNMKQSAFDKAFTETIPSKIEARF